MFGAKANERWMPLIPLPHFLNSTFSFTTTIDTFAQFAAQHLREADVVVIHEWNDPKVVNTILETEEEIWVQGDLA